MSDTSRHDRKASREEVRQFIAETTARRRSMLIPDPDLLTVEDVEFLHSVGITPERTDDEC